MGIQVSYGRAYEREVFDMGICRRTGHLFNASTGWEAVGMLVLSWRLPNR
jgi:hypothetical protein